MKSAGSYTVSADFGQAGQEIKVAGQVDATGQRRRPGDQFRRAEECRYYGR